MFKMLNANQIVTARLGANMSRGDLAYEVRNRTGFKTTERNVRDWEKGVHGPRDGVIVAIANATGRDIEFFYEAGGDTDDEEEAALPDAMAALEQALMRVVRRAVRDEARV